MFSSTFRPTTPLCFVHFIFLILCFYSFYRMENNDAQYKYIYRCICTERETHSINASIYIFIQYYEGISFHLKQFIHGSQNLCEGAQPAATASIHQKRCCHRMSQRAFQHYDLMIFMFYTNRFWLHDRQPKMMATIETATGLAHHI